MCINSNFNITYTAKNETTATTTVMSSETTASEVLTDTGISQPQTPVFSSAVMREITTPTIIASYSQPTTVASVPLYDTIRYDTRCYFNVRSKADISQLNLPHGTDN